MLPTKRMLNRRPLQYAFKKQGNRDTDILSNHLQTQGYPVAKTAIKTQFEKNLDTYAILMTTRVQSIM